MIIFGAPVPILRSFDQAVTGDFFLDILGLETVFEHRFAPDLPLYMGVARRGCVLHLTEHRGNGSPEAGLPIPVGDAAVLRAKGNRNARPVEPSLMPGGSREITTHDAVGNRLTFFSEHPVGQA